MSRSNLLPRSSLVFSASRSADPNRLMSRGRRAAAPRKRARRGRGRSSSLRAGRGRGRRGSRGSGCAAACAAVPAGPGAASCELRDAWKGGGLGARRPLVLNGELRPDRLRPALARVDSVHRAGGIASAPKRADRIEDQPAAARAADDDAALQLIQVGKERVVVVELSCEVVRAGWWDGE